MTHDAEPLAFRDEGEGWHLRARRMLALRAALVLLAGGLIAVAVRVGPDHAGSAAYLLLLALALVLAVPARRVRRPAPPRLIEAPQGRGLLLPLRAASLTGIAAPGLLAAACWLAPLLVVTAPWRGPLDDLPSRAGAALGLLVAVGAGALAALAAHAGVRSRLATDRGIVLLPDRVLLRTQRHPLSLAWDDLRSVRAHWTRVRGFGDAVSSPEDLVQSWLTFEVGADAPAGARPLAAVSRQPHPTLDARSVGTDPDVALALCRHYLAHPEHRGELATEQSVVRATSLSTGAR